MIKLKLTSKKLKLLQHEIDILDSINDVQEAAINDLIQLVVNDNDFYARAIRSRVRSYRETVSDIKEELKQIREQ